MRYERYDFEEILKEELRILAIQTRDRLGITQKKMGEQLYMSESSYSDIETGRTGCGVLTATVLLSMQDDPNDCIEKIKQKFSELYDGELQLL